MVHLIPTYRQKLKLCKPVVYKNLQEPPTAPITKTNSLYVETYLAIKLILILDRGGVEYTAG